MITLRRSQDRGHANHGWLDTHHSFSFANYRDPAHLGFRCLLVINEDTIQPDGGFGTHSHRDMEIITYVITGQLEHQDSMGNGSIIKAGDVQRMSAGTGVAHSEFNPSSTEAVHLLQIWLEPGRAGVQPSYAERHYARADKLNQLQLIVSGVPLSDTLAIHQDAQVFASVLEPGKTLKHTFQDGRAGWLQLISGRLTVNAVELAAGDGAAIADEALLQITSADESEFLLFDLP